MVFSPAQTLDGDFITEPGHHDLTVACFFVLLHGQQVAIHDANVAHAHAAYLEQVVGLALKQTGLKVIGLLNVLLRENRAAGGNPAHQRQGELGQALQGQGKLFVA